MNAERYHDGFGFGKWIVSPKAVDGYVVSFVVSKYVNTNYLSISFSLINSVCCLT